MKNFKQIPLRQKSKKKIKKNSKKMKQLVE